MVNYIYLGYGVTDSNGVAKLDHDANGDPISHSYTGTGAGEIDIVASLDNPITEGSIQSEIFVVTDALYYDEAIEGHKNPLYETGASVTVNPLPDGTVLTIDTNGHGYRLMQDSSNRFKVTAPFVVELDVFEATNMQLLLYQSTDISRTVWFTNTSNTAHYKFIVDNQKVTRIINDGEPSEYNLAYTDALQIWFQSRIANASFKFKNLKIYPI